MRRARPSTAAWAPMKKSDRVDARTPRRARFAVNALPARNAAAHGIAARRKSVTGNAASTSSTCEKLIETSEKMIGLMYGGPTSAAVAKRPIEPHRIFGQHVEQDVAFNRGAAEHHSPLVSDMISSVVMARSPRPRSRAAN